MDKFKILKSDLFQDYARGINGLGEKFETLEEAEISSESFSFYTSCASVYSSKIEGEDIDLDSYVKYKNFGLAFNPDYTARVDDLYSAYIYAQKNVLTATNIAEAHKLLTRNIVSPIYQGELRNQNMYVITDDGKIEYVAAAPHKVKSEIDKLYSDIELLLSMKLNYEEVFYFASYIHLVFVKIHPWIDGNGRSARLIEKWFIAHHLGPKAWFLQSEKFYYINQSSYYANLRKLGLEYDELDFNFALIFLEMLPQSLDY